MIPVCDICGSEKAQLPELTDQTHAPIFVCITVTGKQKMPCDGWVHEIALKNDSDGPRTSL